MIEFTKGNIFDSYSEAYVNPVNCVGIMGKGLAFEFKNKYPNNFLEYQKSCRQHNVVPGKMLVYKTGTTFPSYIINFPTKTHWRQPSKLEYIENGLDDLILNLIDLDIHSVSIPALGCGLGGLSWNTVKKLIIDKLSNVQNVQFLVFEP